MMIYLDINDTTRDSRDRQLVQHRTYTALKSRWFVVLGEFSEVQGPIALRVVPRISDANVLKQINDFIVLVMAVDYTGTHAGVPTYDPADSSMVFHVSKDKISAFVHYFNLHDVRARGYSRIFTLCFITLSYDLLLDTLPEVRQSFAAIAQVCHVENRLAFHTEMELKKINTQADVVEGQNIDWWLGEMKRRYKLDGNKTCTRFTKKDSYPHDDTWTGKRVGARDFDRRRNWKSLPNLSCTYAGVKRTHDPSRGALRHIKELCPFAYKHYLKRCMAILYKTRGSCGRPMKPSTEDELMIGKYTLHFPSPTFDCTNGSLNNSYEEALAPVENSTFYLIEDCEESDIDIENSLDAVYRDPIEPAVGYAIIEDPTLKSQLQASDEPFITEYISLGKKATPLEDSHVQRFVGMPQKARSDTFYQARKQAQDSTMRSAQVEDHLLGGPEMISCIESRTIDADLFKFRTILKISSRDCIFSVMSGRPVIIVGEDEASRAIKNALSVFVTQEKRVCNEIKTSLSLADLTRYTLIQCRKDNDIIKSVDCFAMSGLCSVIRHDKRYGKAPRYTGELLNRIWGVENSRGGTPTLHNYSESTLFSLVQAGLVSEIASELVTLYYTILHHKECTVDGVFGISPADNEILRHQILLILQPNAQLLPSSHNPSVDFKYTYYENFSRTPLVYRS